MTSGTTKTIKIFGSPGAGKTTYLLDIVSKCLEQGISPNEIFYISFSKKATEEAVSRACKRFNMRPKDFPYFRTLHSLCYRLSGLSGSALMGDEDYIRVSNRVGLDAPRGKTSFVEEEDMDTANQTSRLIFYEGLARNKLVDLSSLIDDNNAEEYQKALKQYKKDYAVIDYTDILERFYLEVDKLPPIKVLICDEVQDNTKLHWRCVQKLIDKAEQVYVAGDDDQSIQTWAGADVGSMLSLPGQVKVLEQSYRVPVKVWDVAQKVIKQVKGPRQPKQCSPKAEQGRVDYIDSLEEVPFHKRLPGESWLLLGRTQYACKKYFKMFRGLGLDYNDLKEGGLVKISTIHAAKGGEADNVVLLGNMSRATRICMDDTDLGLDLELRVFYTGITRTKNRLWLCDGGYRGFDLW